MLDMKRDRMKTPPRKLTLDELLHNGSLVWGAAFKERCQKMGIEAPEKTKAGRNGARRSESSVGKIDPL